MAAQTIQVLAAAAVDPILEECGTLGAMEYTPAAGENVSAGKISICLEHQLSIRGVSASPDTAGPDKRECWYGDDHDCL